MRPLAIENNLLVVPTLMQQLQFPDTLPVLRGETVQLRELTEDDIASWYARATDREAADLAGDRVPQSIHEGVDWLRRHRESFGRRLGLRWAIVPKGAGVSVGTVGFMLDPVDGSRASLGIVVARACWNKGIATAAVELALSYAYSRLGVVCVHAEVLQRNAASVRLLEKCRFTLAEVLPPTIEDPEVMLLYRRCLDVDET